MKVGDMVIVNAIPGQPIGVVVEFDTGTNGWPWVMIQDGRMVVWPETSMEVINESR